MISNFLFSFINCCVIVSFFTKLLTLGILFSTALGAILGISSLTSLTLVLRVVLVAKLEISGILSSIFFILAF